MRVERSKMPQFAVNSQLATRNPEPAVLLSPQGRVGTVARWRLRSDLTHWSPSPQGRVKLGCGLSVES
ncbi:hypothetical protein Q2T83_14000 [Fervidibacter sacchari]|uniref:Uncharacterized protein n=1 Tax=Candidatus Fervidibacter sacchari TaxID=1448929 RepID=A0ABT2EQK7_9BACT|nr:hypothetical protein [Candidatus Fervidibacter sacchari]MCS3919721.1 hypothetical protein [Candidatus Fervidibacter sacchari]WKU15435.1 hypothetical protein Q2T83_14000 [Candidatus Fervidibacter sacchari]